jgi:gliding motility-associated-like protein
MKYHSIYTLLIVALSCSLVTAQTTQGLIAYYPFDDCTATDVSPDVIGGNGTVVGNPDCSCGVSGDAMEFDGIDDHVTFNGNVNAVFERNNFTVSFYFKPFNAVSSQNILSKRIDCSGTGSIFNVEYLLSLNFVNVELNESPTKKIAISSNLDATCWHHVAIVRDAKRVKMYLNGSLIDEKVTSTVLDLSNSSLLNIANSPCIGSSTERFRGKLDELRVYNRSLGEDEIQDLYIEPDLIKNDDAIIYLGQSVEAEIPVTCATGFNWTPDMDINSINIPNPILSPTESITYNVSILDDFGCTTTDSIRITVIDPADLDCAGIYLPKAFTPNGDNLNDVYGISNPLAIEQLLSFEIYDRWGTRVFTTVNAEETWDGTYGGTLLNGGVYIYKLSYRCEGEEVAISGTVTMMR